MFAVREGLAAALVVALLWPAAQPARAMAPRPSSTPFIDVETMLKDVSADPSKAPLPSFAPPAPPTKIAPAHLAALRAKYIGRPVWYTGSDLRLDPTNGGVGRTKCRAYRKVKVLSVEPVKAVGGNEWLAFELQHEDGPTGWLVGIVDIDAAYLVLQDPKKRLGWSKDVWRDIDRELVRVGMIDAQASMSWGPPDKVNRTTSAGATREQWVYLKRGAYLYLKNGVVTSIQD